MNAGDLNLGLYGSIATPLIYLRHLPSQELVLSNQDHDFESFSAYIVFVLQEKKRECAYIGTQEATSGLGM